MVLMALLNLINGRNLFYNEKMVTVKGRARIEKIAQERNFPTAFLEGYLLEYAHCREFDTKGNKSTLIINFDLLSEEIIESAFEKKFWTTIGLFMLIDHIDPDDFKERFLRRIIGFPVSPVHPEAILEGRASPYAFPLIFNDIDVVDPLFSLAERFVVFDNGTVYQWKFAELGKSTIRANHSAFSSKEVDLLTFEKSVVNYQELISSQDCELAQLEIGFQGIREERIRLLRKLGEIHIKRQAAISTLQERGEIPRLGRFDYLSIDSDTYAVSTDMAPILYRAALEHLSRARNVTLSHPVPDELLRETVPSIICAYLCLDAHVNAMGHHLKIPNWKSTVYTNLETKIGNICKTRTGSNLLSKRPDLRRDIETLSSMRDNLIHYKFKRYPVVAIGHSYLSELYSYTDLKTAIWSVSLVSKVISVFHPYINLPSPEWLSADTDYLRDLNPVELLKEQDDR